MLSSSSCLDYANSEDLLGLVNLSLLLYFTFSARVVMQRCKHVLPFESRASTSAPSFMRAYTFFYNKFATAKCKGVAPLRSIYVTGMWCNLLNRKIDRTPSYLLAAQ